MPPEREAGEHEIVISLKSGWSQLMPDLKRCELLRRRVTVPSDRAQHITLGVLTGLAIVALGALLAYHIRYHKDNIKRFVESFFKHEGQLAFKICWDAWVRPSLHAVPRI